MERTISKKRILKREKRLFLLRRLEKRIEGCRECGLEYPTAGFGDPLSSIVFLGQSLHGFCSETEKAFIKQIPFIGPMESDSGDVLFAGIERGGFYPEHFWITNIVKCHPSGNAPNQKEWEKKCWHYLVKELSIIRPKFVIALGSQAFSSLLAYSKNAKPGKDYGAIGSVILRVRKVKPFKTTAIKVYHPAYAMRQGPDEEESWVEELGLLLSILTHEKRETVNIPWRGV